MSEPEIKASKLNNNTGLKITVGVLVVVVIMQGLFMFNIYKNQSSSGVVLDGVAGANTEKQKVVGILNCFIKAISELE